MNKIIPFLNRLKKKMYLAVKRYPIAVALLLFAAAMSMVAIDINENYRAMDDRPFIRLAMTAVYGAVLSLTIKSAAERFRFKKAAEWLSYLLVPALMVPVYFMLMPDFDNMEVMLKYMLLNVLTASLFFFVPFIKSDKSASYFAQKIFLRLAVTMIYYGVILGGVEAIIFAVENLLSVRMPNGIYIQTAACLAGLFIPAFFFAGIPEPDDTQASYPKLLKILLHYIVFSLLSAYSVVLYAYFIKILAEWAAAQQPIGQSGDILLAHICGGALLRSLHKRRKPVDQDIHRGVSLCDYTADAHDAFVIHSAYQGIRVHRAALLCDTVRDIRSALNQHDKAAKEGARHTACAFGTASCFHLRAAFDVQRIQPEPEQAFRAHTDRSRHVGRREDNTQPRRG